MQFASGTPITAADAVFSLQRVIKLDKSPAFILSQFGFTADNVDSMIRHTGDITLEFEIRSERQLTYVIVSHDLAVVPHMCERLVVTQQGLVVEQMSRQTNRAAVYSAAHVGQRWPYSSDIQ